MNLIKILIHERAGDVIKGGPVDIVFDVNDIVVPIRFNSNSNKSYFTARTIKDGDNNGRSNAKVNYLSTETLSTIASKTEALVILTVTERRGVVKNESHVFVTNRISENMTYDPLIGTTFYYMEDGDPLPVKYIVSENLNQIISQQIDPVFNPITKTQEYFEFVSGASVTLANTPLLSETFIVFRNGELLTPSKDYSLAVSAISFTVPLLNDNINVIYSY